MYFLRGSQTSLPIISFSEIKLLSIHYPPLKSIFLKQTKKVPAPLPLQDCSCAPHQPNPDISHTHSGKSWGHSVYYLIYVDNYMHLSDHLSNQDVGKRYMGALWS